MRMFQRGKTWWYSFGSKNNRVRQSTGCEDYEKAKKLAEEICRILSIKDDDERQAAAIAIISVKRSKAKQEIAKGVMLADCWDRYPHIKSESGKAFKESTIRTSKQRWLAFVAYANSRNITHAANVTSKIAKQFLDTLAPRSRVITSFVCKAMFRRVGIVPNPFDFPVEHGEIIHREPLTREQIKTLLDTVDKLESHRQSKQHHAAEFAVFVRFLLYTGLRLGDAATARTDQVDWQEKTLTRVMAKTSRPVTFPLHPDLFRRLQGDNPYLFPALARQYRKAPSALTLRFRRLFKLANISGEKQQYCAHCLRTTFASICAENQIPLPVIQSWLGHSSPTVTRIYARIEDIRVKRKALAKFPEL